MPPQLCQEEGSITSARKPNGGTSSLKVLVFQSCLILCDPMDWSLPGSFIHGILQARILEWVPISSSKGYSWPSNQTWVSCIAGRFFTPWVTREAHQLSQGMGNQKKYPELGIWGCFWKIQLFSSVAQSFLTLCDPMNCRTRGFLIHHQLPEFT